MVICRREYFYDGNVLTGQKGYVFFKEPVLYLTGSIKRSNGMVDSVSAVSAWVSGEAQTVSKDFNLFYSMIFDKPETDSVRLVTREKLPLHLKPISTNTFLITKGLSFGKTLASSIRPCTGTHIILSEMLTIMCRKAGTTSPTEPVVPHTITYEYDNHPNPFFNLGMDRSEYISSASLSPNNMVKQTIVSEGSAPRTITYKYEYLPNGYPGKVTITNEFSEPYTLTFEY
jgi:hypothetical protein